MCEYFWHQASFCCSVRSYEQQKRNEKVGLWHIWYFRYTFWPCLPCTLVRRPKFPAKDKWNIEERKRIQWKLPVSDTSIISVNRACCNAAWLWFFCWTGSEFLLAEHCRPLLGCRRWWATVWPTWGTTSWCWLVGSPPRSTSPTRSMNTMPTASCSTGRNSPRRKWTGLILLVRMRVWLAVLRCFVL